LDKKELASNSKDITEQPDLDINIPENQLNSDSNKTKSKNFNQNFPITILKAGLSSLEAIIKFLKENRNCSYKEIKRLLKRNPKTLAVTYREAKKKLPEKFSKYICANKKRIPYSVFNEKLSILESICTYLKSEKRSYSEIGRLIDKDPRTIWTVCKRAEKKILNGDINHEN